MNKPPCVRPPHKHKRPRKPPTPRGALAALAGVLLTVLCLGAVAHFFVNTYLAPFYISSVVSYFPTGALYPIPTLPTLAICLGAGTVCALAWSLPRFRWLAALVLLAGLGVACYLNRLLITLGAQLVWESLSILFTDNTNFPGYFILDLPLSPTLRQRVVQTFLVAAVCLYALPLGWAVVRRQAFGPVFALTLPLLLPAFLAEVALDWPGLLVLCACWAALLLSSLPARANPAGAARVSLAALPVCLAVVMLVSLAFPRAGYLQPGWAAVAREQLLSLDWFSSPDASPTASGSGAIPLEAEVDLTATGPRRYSHRPVLAVEGSQAGPLYLRGMVYTQYTGTAWEDFVSATLPSQPQAAGTEGGGATATATITHLISPSTLMYVPYRTVVAQGRPVLDDAALLLPTPQEEYTLSYLPLEGEPSDVGASVPSLSPEYWDVPEEAARFLLQWYDQALSVLLAAGYTPAGSATGDYAQQLNAASLVAQLLGLAAEYDLSAPAPGPGEDFVTHFLTTGRGYCVHFASAATLLLRLQGIPARYVSGYALSIPESGQAQALDSNAHAWVEIYLEGYGWYPVEVTPTTPIQESSAPQATHGPSPTPSLPPSLQPQQSQSPQATLAPSATPTEGPIPAQGSGAAPLALLWVLPALALLASPVALYLLRRRAWKGFVRNPDRNAAVLAAYGWFAQLERRGVQPSPRTLEIVQKARFSQHRITQEERQAVLSDLRGQVLRLRRSLPAWKRPLLALRYPITP